MTREELLVECFGSIPARDGDKIFELKPGENENGPDVISHVDVYYRRIVLAHTTMTIAGIANVCTDPAHRGKGYASAQLRRAHEEAATKVDVWFAGLFAGRADLYLRLGYYRPDPAGHPTFYVLMLDRQDGSTPPWGRGWPLGSFDTRGTW